MQSTVMCLMAEQGAFPNRPDYAVFADTGWEPQSVYDTVDWLENQVSFPILRTSNGRNLRDDVRAGVNARGRPWMTLPVYLQDKDGKETGINWRQCTQDYKIAPIQAKVREILGMKRREVISHDTAVEMWLGITTDEATRVKQSRNWWITHKFPLIDDMPMSREDCKEWFAVRYPNRELGRSACIGCPFRSSTSWADVMQKEPDLFQEAVDIDASLRTSQHNAGHMFRKLAFLHHRRIPLAEAVALDVDKRESDPFNNECEGHCGL